MRNKPPRPLSDMTLAQLRNPPMPWTDFAQCPEAEKASSQRDFEERLLKWFERQPLIDDLLDVLPLNTLLRVHLSEQGIHLTATQPPMQSVMFAKGRETSFEYPTSLSREQAGVRLEQPDSGTALAFFFLDITGDRFVLDYLHLPDLIPTRAFRLQANYPLDAIEYLRLLHG